MRQARGMKHEAKVKMRCSGSGDHGQSTVLTILTSRSVPETESATRGSLTKQEDAGPRLVSRG